MNITSQESFGQTIDRLLAQAIQEHKVFSLQISINPMQKPQITAISKQPAGMKQRHPLDEIDEIFMIGHP